MHMIVFLSRLNLGDNFVMKFFLKAQWSVIKCWISVALYKGESVQALAKTDTHTHTHINVAWERNIRILLLTSG